MESVGVHHPILERVRRIDQGLISQMWEIYLCGLYGVLPQS